MTAGLHFVHVFATFAVGGPQVRTLSVLAALPGEVRHTVIAMDGRTTALERVPERVQVALARLEGARGFLVVPRLQGLLRTLAPDLLLTYNWGAIEAVLAARLSRLCPVVHHEEGFRPDESPERQKKRRVLFRRYVLGGRVKQVVVPSRLLERVARSTWRISGDRVRYIPNAVDAEKFRPGPDDAGLREEWGAGTDTLVLGAVAHLTPVKDLGTLLSAFATSGLRERALLVIAGEGEEKEMLHARSRQLGIDAAVRWLGGVKDTTPLYRAFDLFCVSSKTEQMPVAVLEAMSSGLPVLATSVGDLPVMVGEANRPYVVARENPEGYVDAMVELAGDAALRRKLGAENRAFCLAEYTPSRMTAAYQAVFESALGRDLEEIP